MQVENLLISGDVPGVEWRVPVLSFKGKNSDVPKVYMQAALHADELPGTAVLHFLCEQLREYENQDLIVGDITIVPSANPIGANQKISSLNLGRFELGGRDNFNRSFPLISYDDRAILVSETKPLKAADRLKANLLSMALEADIVLDLHCDSEALLYAYICDEFWPRATDLAAVLALDAVFLSDGQSSAFEEAVAYAWRQSASKGNDKFVTTLEYRGEQDVKADVAQKDAQNLIAFLKTRGVIKDNPVSLPDWQGVVVPLDDIEVMRAEVSGTVLFHKKCGDTVFEGELMATVLTAPGQDKPQQDYFAPQSGLVVTRTMQRFVHVQDQLMKIAGEKPSQTKRKPGTLEQQPDSFSDRSWR